jgi:SAM-dependent methyltransferase
MNEKQELQLYRDGRHYDALNRHIVADIPFYVEEAQRASGEVLEIACGTGRLTIPIAQAGVKITGLDVSPSMLAHARSKANLAGIDISWVEADCREFALQKKFRLIFIPFNSMQHLHDLESLRRFFAKVREHLAPGGRFIVDVFNPSVVLLNRDPSIRYCERTYDDPDGRGVITLEQTSKYDDAAQVNRILWYFSRDGEPDFRVEKLELRCFFPQELDLVMHAHGFRIEQKFGNFERKPFAKGDPKQIVVCKLPG